MHRIYLLIFTLFGLSVIGFSQTSIIFSDSAIVRSSPSMKGKILTYLPQFYESFTECFNETYVADTINGNAGFWQAIQFKNSIAYVWNNNFAAGVIKNLNNEKLKIIFRRKSPKQLEFKVQKDAKFIYYTSLESPVFESKIYEFIAVGKTYLSEYELFAVVNENQKYQLLEWTGSEIRLSKVKLAEDGFITKLKNDSVFSFAAKAQTRLFSSKDSTVTPAKIISIDSRLKVFIEDKYNFQDWYKVEFQEEKYYIPYQDLSLTFNCIQSNKHPGLSFIKTTKAIYAMKGDKIIDKLSIPEYHGQEEIYEISSLGLETNLDFLGVVIQCYTEGCDYGRDIYTWNDKKIKNLCYDTEWGDYGIAGGTNFSFPNENDESKINHQVYEKAFFNDPFNPKISDCFLVDFMYFEENYVYKLVKDSLIEVPTFESKFRKYFSKNYKNYRLAHTYPCDLNGDGKDDMLFYYNRIDSVQGILTNHRLAYCLTDSNGTFKKAIFNSKLMNDSSLEVKFVFENGELEIIVVEEYIPTDEDSYTIAETKDEENYNQTMDVGLKAVKYKFVYDSSIQKLRFMSSTTSIGIPKDYYIYQWNIQKTIRARGSDFFENSVKQ